MEDRREYGGFQPRSFAPVKVGDELDVEIEAVGEKGDGVAKKDGFVLFVPGTKKGDNVRVKVTRVLRKMGFAEVVGEGSSEGGEQQPEESGEQKSQEAETSEPQEGSEQADNSQDTEDFGEEEKKEEDKQ